MLKDFWIRNWNVWKPENYLPSVISRTKGLSFDFCAGRFGGSCQLIFVVKKKDAEKPKTATYDPLPGR